MRFVWTDAGDDPDWGTGDRHGINGYFAPLWDDITEEVLHEAAQRGHNVGAYFGHNWRPNASAESLVTEVTDEYGRLAARLPQLRLMWNLEQHEPDYIADVLERWRKNFPKVNTSWSPEGMQGGWMSSDFVARVLATKTRVVPQAFVGSMERRESDIVLRDVVRRGFPENVVSIFYSAAQLGRDWDGYAFRMGTLPATPGTQ
jgi:hypothetical protein